MQSLSDVLVMIASGMSILGIPTLLIIVNRLHGKHLRAIKTFQFDGTEGMLIGVRESHARIQRELENQLRSEEPKTRANVAQEIEKGLENLDKARIAAKSLEDRLLREMHSLYGSHSAAEGDILNLVFFEHNLQVLKRLALLFDELADLDKALLKSLKSEPFMDARDAL